MKLRFSIRLLFVLLGMAGIALYLFFVRPTSIANRFVAAIDHQDYAMAKPNLPAAMQDALNKFDGSIDRVNAETEPREWEDVWKCRRRIIVHVYSHLDAPDRHIDWVTDFDLTASAAGLSVVPIDFRFPSTETTVEAPED